MARMTIQQRKRIQRILAARQSERPPSVQLPPSVKPPHPTTCPPGWITNSSGSFQPPPPGPVPGFLSGRSLKDYDKRLSPDSNTAGERGAYGATEVFDVVDWAYEFGGLLHSLATSPAFSKTEAMDQLKKLEAAKKASEQTSGIGTWWSESGANTPNQELTEVLAHVGTGLKLFKEIYGASRVETQNNFYLAGDDELTGKMGNIMAPGDVSQRSKFFRKQLIGESNSPKTYKYLMGRAGKNIGKLALDTTASVTKTGGGGFVKAAHEGSSSTSSGIHAASLAKIRKSAGELSGSADLKLILTVLENMKISKALIRGTTAVLDCIPIPGVAEIGGVVLSVGKTARKLAYTEIVQNMCQLIHFLALREQYIYDGSVTAISGNTSDLNKGGKPFNPHGYAFCAKKPATEIFRSIIWRDMWYAGFGSKRMPGCTSIQYDYKTIIKEPAGWMVMFDKAMSD